MPPSVAQHLVISPDSVVTAHLINEAAQPEVAARDEILSFSRQRLLPRAAAVAGCASCASPSPLRSWRKASCQAS
mgnify:FL=1